MSTQSKKQRTRQKIIEASIRCFARQGIENVSLQTIADALGVTQPSLFYHFKKKELILPAVLEAIVLRNHHIVLGTQPKKKPHKFTAIETHVMGNLRWAYQHQDDVLVLIHCFSRAGFDKSITRIVETIIRTGRERIASILKETHIKKGRSAHQAAELIQEVLTGSIMLSTLSKKTPERRAKELMSQIHHILKS